jgi:hypothetical protein
LLSADFARGDTKHSRRFPFVQWDVFSKVRLAGNPVIVFPDARDLSDEEMQAITQAPLCEWIGHICREGAVADPAAGLVAMALYVRGEIPGLLAVWFPAEEAVNVSNHRDTLSAIGTVAAAALENVRSVERLQAENASLLDRLGDRLRVVQQAA